MWEMDGERSQISQLNSSRQLHSPSRRLFPPSLNSRHHLLALCSFIEPSSFVSTLCLWISAGRKVLVFKNPITDCTSLVAEFTIFVFFFNDNKEWKKLLLRNMQSTCSCWHTEDDSPSYRVRYYTVMCNPRVAVGIQKMTVLDTGCVITP